MNRSTIEELKQIPCRTRSWPLIIQPLKITDMKTGNRNILRLLSLAGLTAFSTSLFAQNAAAETAKPAAITTEALFWVLLLVAIILMYVIYSMSEMIIWGVKRKMEQRKGGAGLLLLLAGTLLGSSSASAQDAAATVVAAPAYNFWTDPYMPFYLLILVEVVVIAWMALVLFNMMRPEKAVEPEVQRVSVLTAIWNKINPTFRWNGKMRSNWMIMNMTDRGTWQQDATLAAVHFLCHHPVRGHLCTILPAGIWQDHG